MKLHQIALAVAALAAGSANAAMTAGEQAIVNNAQANGRVVFISGASAVQSGFDSIINTTFSGATIRFANTTAASRDFEAAAGVFAAGTGAWAGQNGIIIYRVKGGSAFGVNPVARDEKIEALKVTTADCGATGSGTQASPYVCTTTGTASPATTGVSPDAGVSDVAPALFKNPVNTEGEIPAAELTDAERSVLSSTAIYGLAFGIPVTNTVSASTKFTRSTVAAIMAGNVGTWDQIDGNNGSDDIVICRRVPGSGTQAVMNMWAGGYGCSANANAPADRDASGAWDPVGRTFTVGANTGGLVVVENSTSGDVKSCLNAAATGGSYTTKDRDGQPVNVTFTGAHKAIGVLSLDSLNGSTTTSKWQFRSLDGAGTYTWDGIAANPPVATGTGKFPTFAAYENGDWDLQGWESFNIPARTTGAKLDVLKKFLVNAQNPAVLQGITALKNVALGIPGGLYTGPFVSDAAYVNGDQCAPYNRNYND
jgi:hypothetical protein